MTKEQFETLIKKLNEIHTALSICMPSHSKAVISTRQGRFEQLDPTPLAVPLGSARPETLEQTILRIMQGQNRMNSSEYYDFDDDDFDDDEGFIDETPGKDFGSSRYEVDEISIPDVESKETIKASAKKTKQPSPAVSEDASSDDTSEGAIPSAD